MSQNLATVSQRALLPERIASLINALSSGVYEREHTIKMCLLAALAGESIFLLGPPGIAKSYIAKRLIEAFDNSQFFEYLMTRFSTPEEVFGPLSIQALKDEGKYVRLTDGYLPNADVVFLDEIWKAGPAILNTLLTVVNERTFKNGEHVYPVPMRLLVTASNELPEPDSGLDALYDRMLLRVFVNRIQEKKNFKLMLTEPSQDEATVADKLKISHQEYQHWQTIIPTLDLPDAIFEKLYTLKQRVENAGSEQSQFDPSELYVSDRRWKKAVRLLKAAAFFNGRDEVAPLDLLLLEDCLWHSPESRDVVQTVMQAFAKEVLFDQQEVLALIDDVKVALEEIEQDTAEALTYRQETATAGLTRKAMIDVSQSPRFTVNQSRDLVRFVLLRANPSVSEQEKGDSRWVYLDAADIEKKLKTGSTDLYGYVNKNNHLCRLTLEWDAQHALVIKDIANRPVPMALVGVNDPSESQLADWKQQTDHALEQLQHAQFLIRRARSQLNAGLPHLFAQPDLLEIASASLVDVEHEVKTQIDNLERQVNRLARLGEYFSGASHAEC
ncbi:AAA family ATPase [Salinivibrio kushneri]|uniref:AAA family ATPase n=1 Tax=Salinivibrio kushneri TaxID=1908198 RepID=UPI000988901F|nr:AAA family ATPase [Salinivibrio kushneri]OOE35738.1 AAA family ATPase [Salinivibrio kushneri]OOE54586.1 AAA family ATPase [Salinivibrio kushneri]